MSPNPEQVFGRLQKRVVVGRVVTRVSGCVEALTTSVSLEPLIGQYLQGVEPERRAEPVATLGSCGQPWRVPSG